MLGEKGIDVKAQSSIDEASIEIVKKKFHSAKSENKKEEKTISCAAVRFWINIVRRRTSIIQS